jgi:hypothetical protein
MTSITIETAVNLNNEAVLHLVRGDERMALLALQTAVGRLKVSVHSICRPSDDDMKEMGSPTGVEGVDLPPLTNVQSYFYNRALLVVPEDLLHDPVGAAHLCSVVFIFNLALALHRASLKHIHATTESSADRTNALYGMVLKLLPTVDRSDFSGVLRLAAINNLSQLRFEAGDYPGARRGFEEVARLLTMMGVTRMGPIEVRGLWFNVLLLTVPEFAPAA